MMLKLPIYEKGRQKEYTVEELVSLLFDPISEKVCTTQPTAVCHNCCFMVNLNCVCDAMDLRADDCGVRIHKGIRKTYVVVDDSKAVLEDVQLNYVYLLTRVYVS